VNGVAAWVEGSTCGNNECVWRIATITGGERKARVIDTVDIPCPGIACGPPPVPRPAVAGKGNLLVYSSGGSTVDKVFRIVGRRHVLFAVQPAGGIEKLAVGGGAVEVVSTVLDTGDGCGCLDTPAWSPDGSKIAYFDGSFANQQDDPGPPDTALAVMNADGSGRHDLTAPANLNANPSLSWSPDGKQIAYATDTSSGSTIEVVNADGSDSLQLGTGYDPTWSPDGTKIAFVNASCGAECGCANTPISVMNPDGTNTHELASIAAGSCIDDHGMAWSPDGTRIAFSLIGGGTETLEVMNADGTNIRRLTGDNLANEPAWSPDSSQIVFHDPNGLAEIGADGTNLHQLTNGPDEYPSWSPDDRTIVFGSDRNDPYANIHQLYPNTFPELYLVNPDGSNLHPLSFTKPAKFEQQHTLYTANGKRLPALPGIPTLSGQIAAVGNTSPAGSHEITLFSTTSGAQLARVKVGTGKSRFVIAGADAHWIVFLLGTTVAALNTTTRKVTHLTTAAANPVDISVATRRVAWAENLHGHGRILTLELPS
jgi:TolB protein